MLCPCIRSQDEKFDKVKGPSIDELVSRESVDKLSYMGWTVDQGKDPEKVGYIVTVPSNCRSVSRAVPTVCVSSAQDAVVSIEETLASGEAIDDRQESLRKYRETWESTEEVLGAEHIKRFEVCMFHYLRM